MKDEAGNASVFIHPPSSILLHASLIIGIFAAMAAWTWLKWPDPLVDFGRELYIPWQISEGKALYHDLAYFNGPLSPYFNAMMFKLLGVSLRTLVLVNLLVLAGLTWMSWRVISLIADRFAATVACVAMLTICCFIQLVLTGNYNFITPYSHELTHGIVLSMAGLLALSRFIDRRRGGYAALVGGIVGLIFLTKIEVFLAGGSALVIGFALSRPSPRAWGVFAASILLPPLMAFVALCTQMPIATALRGVAGSWVYAFDPVLRAMPFYQRVMGTNDLASNSRSILLTVGAYVAVLAGAWVVTLVCKRNLKAVLGISIVAAVSLFVVMDRNGWQNQWQGVLHGFSLVIPAIALITSAFAARRPLPQRILRAALSIFAAGMLLKIFFDVRFTQYGFALALPATLLFIAAMLGWLPAAMDRRGQWGDGLRAALVPVVGLVIFVHLYVFSSLYSAKQTIVGSGKDAFRSDPATARDPRGAAVNEMLKNLTPLPAGATLAVWPEGAMINYLSRRTNPTGYVSLMPPEVAMFGEEKILQSLSQRPPDLIVLQRVADLSEYGRGDFQTGYGEPIYRWIIANYVAVSLPQGPNFPMTLFKRR